MIIVVVYSHFTYYITLGFFFSLILKFNSRFFFIVLAKINKLMFPSLFNKDITTLKGYEKLMLGYRFWVTKNSL